MIELENLIKKNYDDYLQEHGLFNNKRHHPTYETYKEIFTLGMVTQETINKLNGGVDAVQHDIQAIPECNPDKQ